MNKDEFITEARRLGWRPDAYGHLKFTTPAGRMWRLKLQKLAWRLEVQSVVPAGPYSPESKVWLKSKSGYYKDTALTGPSVHRVPPPPGAPPTADVVEKPDNGFLEQVLRKSLPTGPEPAPPMPAGMFPSWHPAHRGTPQE